MYTFKGLHSFSPEGIFFDNVPRSFPNVSSIVVIDVTEEAHLEFNGCIIPI